MLRSLRVPLAMVCVATSSWLALPRAVAQSVPGNTETTAPIRSFAPTPTPTPTPSPTPARAPSVLTANPRLALTGQNVTFELSPANGTSSVGIVFGDGSSGTLVLVPGTQLLTASHAYGQVAPNGYQACVSRPVAAALDYVAPSICALVVVRTAPAPSPSPSPTAFATPAVSPTPLVTATPSPSPTVAPTPRPTATTATPTLTPVVPRATPRVPAAPDAYIIVTFPDGSHALSVPYGGIAPAPYAQIVSQSGGRATVQWTVDGLVVTTSRIDVLAHSITRVDYKFMLPVGGSHTLIATLLPLADSLATPDPRAYVQYRYAPPTLGVNGGSQTISHITLTSPAAIAYVPSIDDALRLSWSEDTAGVAQDFIVRFLDRDGVQIASADMGTATLLAPDVPLEKRLAAAANAGRSATDHSDITWEVDGVVNDAHSGQQRLVESSDRWPLAATDTADGLGICQTDPKFLRGDSAVGFLHAGPIVSILGRLDLIASPYAAAFAPAQNDGYVRFTNVFVDWGDGSIEALALRTKNAIDERAGPIVLDTSTGPGHRYSDSRDFHTRIFEMPAASATPSHGPPNFDAAYAAACATLPALRSVPL